MPTVPFQKQRIKGRIAGYFTEAQVWRDLMAVQKSRKSRSTRGMRRSHDALGKPTLAVDSTSGQKHRRHHITADGYYRGRQVIQVKQKETTEE